MHVCLSYFLGACLFRGIAIVEARKNALNHRDGRKLGKKNIEQQKPFKFVAVEVNVQLKRMKRKWETIFFIQQAL